MNLMFSPKRGMLPLSLGFVQAEGCERSGSHGPTDFHVLPPPLDRALGVSG